MKNINTYIYPQNLKAEATLWLWSLKDFLIIIISALASAMIFAHFMFVVPLAVTGCYAFLTIRVENGTLLDFIKYSCRYFVFNEQYFEWRLG